MIQTYDEALQWIHNRLRFGIKPGLERMNWMLEQLDYPHQNIKAIHIAGTNGKGSTVTYMRHMLQEAGYNVGTFTSPYIETFNERISINGTPISDEDMLRLVQEVKAVVERVEETEFGAATEFEVITLMFFLYFGYHKDVDYVLVEAGLGGRYDSTNVVEPLLTIITNIGFDHMAVLGNTVDKIAFEKAGIIKSAVPLVTGVEQKEAIEVIESIARDHEASLDRLGRDFTIESYKVLENGEAFTLQTPVHTYENLELGMFGYHQVKNATLAIRALEILHQKGELKLSYAQLAEGLKKARWSGRFEKISDSPLVIIDGAHNQEGVDSLLSTLRLHYENKRIHIIFSCLNDKSAEEMVASLEDIAESITFTSFDFPRARTGQELYELSKHPNKKVNEEWQEAIEQALLSHAKPNNLIIITGSLYFISEVRSFLLHS
ncbi:bifunctional folylpolyglutamate synthase/dihydrofolate synthase [Priestia flexa]|uniref:bifunctional folylpolyglutamate synthase/dihydrofolate synthase n=1 Tax=Priestia flexa TaxID=86664 RepID=UPI0022068E0F|nr:folylpolyglutamate synthase/dihydrofolate synthase family protein [Priestia flexa]MDT2045306.1 bifunctional folylpolyglutamate synthase/dihydrofolate synthase [Priestia flexa]USY54624.1 bifunctional folylpolyglutamate synthase/dihydrofolate synthase [Bacillus sp. 1780r2a1]